MPIGIEKNCDTSNLKKLRCLSIIEVRKLREGEIENEFSKKAIQIGIIDFKSFYEKAYYYVDKTLMIKDILDKRSKVLKI